MSMPRTPVFLRVLRTRRKALAIWAAALGGVCSIYTSLYPMMEKMDVEAMLAAMPPAMVEALGYDDMGSAAGYIGSATWGLVALALLLVFAIGNGARLLAGHEEDGGLELELTAPVSRRAIYAQRLAALWVQSTALVLVVFAVTLFFNTVQGLEIPLGDLGAATLQLALVVGFFGSTAFGAGAATGRRGVALAVGAGLAVASWMANAIGPTVDLDWLSRVSPIGWYMDDNPLTRGFHPLDAGLLAVSSVIVIAIGWVRFVRRDLMT